MRGLLGHDDAPENEALARLDTAVRWLRTPDERVGAERPRFVGARPNAS
jgi:hypothetical protein